MGTGASGPRLPHWGAGGAVVGVVLVCVVVVVGVFLSVCHATRQDRAGPRRGGPRLAGGNRGGA